MFHLCGTAQGQFCFGFYAKGGARLLQSVTFPSRESVILGIGDCCKASPFDEHYIRHRGRRRPYFSLTSLAHALLGVSGPFPTDAEREAAISYCRAHIQTAGAMDRTPTVRRPASEQQG